MLGRFASVSLLLTLVACGSPSGDADAGSLDAHVLPPSELFGPCEEDSQCPGEGAICRRDDDGYPRGYCTLPCDDRTPCDAFGSYHHCTQLEGQDRSYCEQRCLNGIDCGRTSYTCVGELPPSGGVCLGVCFDDAHCSEGYECERYSGRCYPAGTAPTTGAETGAPCDDDDACRSGICATPLGEGGVPTGYVQGMCVGRCLMPAGWNSNTLYDGDVLPPGTCPGNTVCFPAGNTLSEGDLGNCLPSCTGDSDCRPGYQCANAFQLTMGPVSFDNGVCRPIDCSMTDCPSGYQCVQVGRADGSVSNVCAPN